ncbi:MAG: MbnP family protein [Saprospiraceae bacterium]
MKRSWVKNSDLMKLISILTKGTLFLFVVILFSCGTKNEGCTDANASNFDVSADANCCCIYPQLGVQFIYYNGLKIVGANDTFIDADNNRFIVDKVKFYVSGINYILESGEALRSDKRVWLYLTPGNGNDSTRSIDDYALIDRAQNTLRSLTLTGNTKIQRLEFLMGVVDSALTNQPVFMKNLDHPLAPNRDSMYNVTGSKYMTMKIIYRGANDATIHDTLYLEGLDARVPVGLNVFVENKVGFDALIPIKVRLDKLFEGVRLKEDNHDELITRIKANSKNIFEK